jgi:glycine C-acetyltransferase
MAAVDMLQNSDEAVQTLWQNTRFLQDQLRHLGFDLGRTQTPITPIMVGDAQRAKTFSAELFKAGIFAQAIAFPTVPHDTARLRLMVSATHSRADLELAVQTLGQIGRQCGVIG